MVAGLSREALHDKMVNGRKSITDIEGVRWMSTEFEGQSPRWTREKVMARPTRKSRKEVIEVGGEETRHVPDILGVADPAVGQVFVVNEGAAWDYDPRSNAVHRYSVSNGESFSTVDDVSDLLNPGSEVNYVGEGTAAHRHIHRITLRPASSNALIEEAEIGLDAEFWYPLEQSLTIRMGDKQVSTQIRYENVCFNSGVPDSMFEFDPPASANVIE